MLPFKAHTAAGRKPHMEGCGVVTSVVSSSGSRAPEAEATTNSPCMPNITLSFQTLTKRPLGIRHSMFPPYTRGSRRFPGMWAEVFLDGI